MARQDKLKAEIVDELKKELYTELTETLENLIKRGFGIWFDDIETVDYDSLVNNEEKLAWTIAASVRNKFDRSFADTVNRMADNKLSYIQSEKFIDKVVERIRRKQLG